MDQRAVPHPTPHAVTSAPHGHTRKAEQHRGASLLSVHRGIGPIRVIIVLIGAVVAALLVGFLAGLLSFKVKDRWCPHCGATTSDLARQHAGPAR